MSTVSPLSDRVADGRFASAVMVVWFGLIASPGAAGEYCVELRIPLRCHARYRVVALWNAKCFTTAAEDSLFVSSS
jgi:hypothetical protein